MLKPSRILDRLSAAWTRLPARERLMLALLFYEGLTPTEAARALGCSVREVERTVENRLARLSGLVHPAARASARRPRRRGARTESRRWAA